MNSDLLTQLWQAGVLQRGIVETLAMTLLSTLFAYLLGLPLGVLLTITGSGKQGLCENKPVNRTLGAAVNVVRSIPFLILMVALLGVARAIVGTAIGNKAVVVTLVIAAAPFVARMVESSLLEVDAGVIEAAQAMGASNLQIICRVLLPEALPSLLQGAVISTVTILGYSAMAGTVGGGGLGQIAIAYGHQRSHKDVIWVCLVLIVLIVQLLQELGGFAARRLDRRARH